MPDSVLNITVTVDDGVANLKQLESAIKAQRAAWKDAAIGSQEYTAAGQKLAQMIDQKNELTKIGLSYDAQVKQSYFSMGEALRVQTVGEKGLTDVIKSARQERRMYMFAVREAETALTSVIGKESAVTSAMTNGTSAVFGMKFALESMGVAAKAAWPVAIIVAAWSVISGIIDSSKKKTEELNTVLRENLDLEIKLGRIAPETGVEADVAQLKKEQDKLDALKKIEQIEFKNEYGTVMMSRPGTETVGSAKEIADQINLIDKLQLKISEGNKKIADENGKALDEFKGNMDNVIANEDKQEKATKETKQNIQDQTSAMWQLGKIDDASYLAILKKREQQQELLGLYNEELSTKKMIEEVERKIAASKMGNSLNLGSALSGGKFNLVGTGYEHLGAIADKFGTGKSTTQLNTESDQKEAQAKKDTTQEYLIEPLRSGFQSVTYSAMSGLNRMWEQSSGFAKTVIGQAFESIADDVLTKLAVKGGESLLSMIPGFGFLAHAANGINLGYGAMQNVMVGERGPELMQVGRNGVRVISNNNLQMMNQASQASRGGSEIANAINVLNSHVARLSAGGGDKVLMMTKSAAQVRSGRVF
jgi:hypothetical protein